jgi:hypothetical protein
MPYNILFPTPTPESLLAEGSLCPTHQPTDRSPYDLIDLGPHSTRNSPRSFSPPPSTASAAISVDNYDPRSRRRIFNDPLTLQALANLRIRQSDLYFPVAEDLAPIAGDKVFYKDRLVERSLRLADAVRAERGRLMRETAGPAPIPDPPPRYALRPSTTKSSALPMRPEEQPTPAVLRAREIEEHLLRARRERVMEKERRHERSVQLLEIERQRGQELQREANVEKRERSHVFNEKVRKEQMERILEYEAGGTDRRARTDGVQREGKKARLQRTIGERFAAKSQIFAPVTFAESD